VFVDDLRKALNESARSGKEIAEEADIHPVTISQFKTGVRRALPLVQMDRLAETLGFAIRLVPLTKKRK
jgi:transcriptional regulator with XRE-family HTH domain